MPGARDTLTSTELWAVAFSPDGTRIAAADMNGLLWLWDAESLQVKFVVHTGDIFRVNCLAYSPDGLWLATVGARGRAKVCATREAAMAELTRHSQAAAPFMRKELSRAISLEQQRRLQSLVTQADQLHGRIGLIVSLLAQHDTPAGERLFSRWASMDGAVGRAAALHKPHVRSR